MIKVVQHSWLGGQIDLEMLGRQDIAKYRKGATRLLNFLPVRRGSIRKRPGTTIAHTFSTEIPNNGKIRIIPFAYKENIGCTLILTHHAAYVYIDDDSLTNKIVQVTPEDNSTITYDNNELDSISYCQCGDIMFLAHRNHPPAMIRHTSATSFTYRLYSLNGSGFGKPIITNSVIARNYLNYDYRGASKTEHYAVSAIFENETTGETVESPVYYMTDENEWTEGSGGYNQKKYGYATAEPANKASLYKNSTATTQQDHRTSWYGTSYYMPFTDSQTITLNVRLPIKTGYRVKQVRLYKEVGGVYGLVAIDDGNRVAVKNGNWYLYYTDQSGESTTSANVREISKSPTYSSGTWTARLRIENADPEEGDPETYEIERTNTGVESATTIEFEFPNVEPHIKAVLNKNQSTWTLDDDLSENVNEVSNIKYNSSTKEWSATLKVQDIGTAETVYHYITLYLSGPTGTATSLTFECKVNPFTAVVKAEETQEMLDDGAIPDTSVTPLDRKDVFDGTSKYPGCVALYQQRLVWASSISDPARIWMSATGDFYEHRPHSVQQSDDAIDFILPIIQFAEINHIIELGRLFAFSASSEILVGSNSEIAGITYETIQANTQSHVGSSKRLPPIIANNSIIFVDKSEHIVHEFSLDVGKNLYGGKDISILSSSILDGRTIVDWTWQQYPNSTVWMVLSDGTLASMCFIPDQEICAWATHSIGGNGKAIAIAKTCAIQNGESVIMIVVERTDQFDQKTTTLEKFSAWPNQPEDTVARMITLDSKYPASVGDYVPYGAVAINADGEVVVSETDEDRTLSENATIGYPINAEMVSVIPAISDEDIGAGQFDVKNVHQVSIRVINSVGGTIRALDVPAEKAAELKTFNPKLSLTVEDGKVLTPITDVRCLISGSNNRDGRVIIANDEPWPFEIIMMESDIAVEAEGQQRQ